MLKFISKVFLPVCVVAVMFGSGIVKAEAVTMAELQAQITALLAQIAQMQGGGGSSSTILDATAQCPTINLRFGDRDVTTGGQVSRLQSFLVKKYNLNRADYVTGYFGHGTQGLVSRFESENGIPVTGWANETTLGEIGRECNKGGEGLIDLADVNIEEKSFAYDNGGFTIDGTSEFMHGRQIVVFASTFDYGSVSMGVMNGQVLKGVLKKVVTVADTGRWMTTFKTAQYRDKETYYVYIYDAQTSELMSIFTRDILKKTTGNLSCTLITDKTSYRLGDTIRLGWTSSSPGTSYLRWTKDISERDMLTSASLMNRKLPTSGNGTVKATVLGNPTIGFTAYGKNGDATNCSVKVEVFSEAGWNDPSASADAVIDESSLTVVSDKDAVRPVITGTAKNVSSLSLVVSDNYGAVSAADSVSVINGRWSASLSPALTSGTYAVLVSGGGKVITSATLTVRTNLSTQSQLDPTITRVEPTPLISGQGATAYGTNITYNIKLELDGKQLRFVSYNTGRVTFTVPSGLLPGGYQLKITNTLTGASAVQSVTVAGTPVATLTKYCSPGFRLGVLYGSDVYTDDSDVCTAALHAGVVRRDIGGSVSYQKISGQPSYTASTKNGVASQRWGSWTGSFQFTSPVLQGSVDSETTPVPDAAQDGGNAMAPKQTLSQMASVLQGIQGLLSSWR